MDSLLTANRTPPNTELAPALSRAADLREATAIPESNHEGQSLILLRYVLIAAAAYLFLFEGETSHPSVIATIIATALLSNVLLSHVSENVLMSPLAVGIIVCVDIAWIALGLWYKGQLGSDIFFLYFFVLFLAAMGQHLLLIVGAGALIGLVDFAVLMSPSQGHPHWNWASPSLIRIPFIFSVALFYGYLTEGWKRERRWVILEKEFADRLAQIVQEQTQGIRKLYEQAKEQAIELERANQVKSDFLSIMSHELRTPLSIVMGYAGIIKERTVGEVTPGQETMLNKIVAQARDLNGIVNSILDATAIESQALRLANQDIDLTEFLSRLKLFYDVPLKEEVTLIWNDSPDLPVVSTDAGKLRHILRNLIDNAVKFTERGQVTISAKILSDGIPPFASPGVSAAQSGKPVPETPGKNWLEFRIADTGIGMSPEAQPTIFEMFQQGDNSPTRPYGGIGMGLYIVKKLTEIFGGSIGVESLPGKGSTFTLTVPITLVPVADASRDR